MVPYVPIHTARHKGFTRRLPKRCLKMDCARKIHTELPLGGLRTDEHTTRACVETAERIGEAPRSSRCYSRGLVIQTEDLLVESIGSGRRAKDRIDIGYGCRLELWARENYLNRRGQQDSQAFGIKKEKQPILLDGPSQRTRPLIGDIERAEDCQMLS